MKVKISGIQVKITCCAGSAGGGLSRICTNIVMPMMIGQMPMASSPGGVHGISPKRLKICVGSGADRSWIQPKNGACRISMVTNSTL